MRDVRPLRCSSPHHQVSPSGKRRGAVQLPPPVTLPHSLPDIPVRLPRGQFIPPGDTDRLQTRSFFRAKIDATVTTVGGRPLCCATGLFDIRFRWWPATRQERLGYERSRVNESHDGYALRTRPERRTSISCVHLIGKGYRHRNRTLSTQPLDSVSGGFQNGCDRQLRSCHLGLGSGWAFCLAPYNQPNRVHNDSQPDRSDRGLHENKVPWRLPPFVHPPIRRSGTRRAERNRTDLKGELSSAKASTRSQAFSDLGP